MHLRLGSEIRLPVILHLDADSIDRAAELLASEAAAAAAAGLEPSVWVPPPSLHLTLAMLKMYSAEQRRRACEVRG